MNNNIEKLSPLELGIMGCEAVMNQFAAEELPPKNFLFYHQGVFLSGVEQIFKLSKDEKYFQYIKKYVDSVIGENGEIYGICHELDHSAVSAPAQQSLTMLDYKQPIILFYNLYEVTKDIKYKNAIEQMTQSMYYWPVNVHNGYWHAMFLPHQVWLDGAYMAGPLSAMYSTFGDSTLLNRAIEQMFIIDKNMKDKNSGLYFHAWDPSKESDWADKATGLSSQIWSRAVGWYSVAMLDILDYVPQEHPKRSALIKLVDDLLSNLIKYQDEETGFWYQVLDKPEREDNWIETSATCLFIYSYAKALRKGIVKKDYHDTLIKAYNGVKKILYTDENNNLVIDNICAGTCVESGTYEHYISSRRVKNDLHGAGAFILMCAEVQRYLDSL